MAVSIAHLGPSGTYTEAAALVYSNWLTQNFHQESFLCAYPSIAQTLNAAALKQADLAVVPIENSIEGSVTTTLDTLWILDDLQIQRALILPISHALLSHANEIEAIQTIYSHPQALAQCQAWLERHRPNVQLIPTSSTTEALQKLEDDRRAGAISSQRAALLYKVPILAHPINDHPDNCTRFWVLGLQPSAGGNHTSLAFSVHDVPGALVKPLDIFAQQGINLSRIESRPTKRSLGDYLFFVDLEADTRQSFVQSALAELRHHTDTLKVLGSYDILSKNIVNLANL
ncbi:prephenate dehydratase [Phormidium sp. CLA17]|uniref:prephenate dehydratase n=1 Tax=Leptolyngbya sp. Cla-17 TaxID=2803751 RepID=UPI001492F4BF|nr:prephenate dehydratase [Leptolyngbya sp. Cla-17]MBM0741052.1 prephenate dehydratase [Leptolyngbya sp. Cla-17]